MLNATIVRNVRFSSNVLELWCCFPTTLVIYYNAHRLFSWNKLFSITLLFTEQICPPTINLHSEYHTSSRSKHTWLTPFRWMSRLQSSFDKLWRGVNHIKLMKRQFQTGTLVPCYEQISTISFSPDKYFYSTKYTEIILIMIFKI